LVLIVSHLWLRSLLAEAKRHWAATAEIIAQKIHAFSSKPQQRSLNAEFMPRIIMARHRQQKRESMEKIGHAGYTAAAPPM